MSTLWITIFIAQDAAPVPPDVMQEITEQLQAAYANGGWLALAGTALTVAIRVVRLPMVQHVVGLFSAKLVWINWPRWLRRLLPFALPFLGGMLLAVSAGSSWIAAITAGLTAGVGMGVTSLVTHKATKALGNAEAKRKVKADPAYKPSGVRKMGSLLVPIVSAVDRVKKAEGIVE